MKIILIKNCDLGKVGTVLEMKAGYANNFLLPQKIAIRDSAKAKKIYQGLAKKESKQVQQKNDEKQIAINKIKKDSVLNIHAKANEQGHLYAALGDKEFIQALTDQLSLVKGNLQIKLITVIKDLGKYTAELSINNVNKKININIKQLNDHQAN